MVDPGKTFHQVWFRYSRNITRQSRVALKPPQRTIPSVFPFYGKKFRRPCQGHSKIRRPPYKRMTSRSLFPSFFILILISINTTAINQEEEEEEISWPSRFFLEQMANVSSLDAPRRATLQFGQDI